MVTNNLVTRTIVGLEIHVQLATRTKLFCGCALEFGAEPNSRVCPVCLGLPGALPVLNEAAIRKAMTLSLALNCSIAAFTKWDRKSYYYPDLPKNYQISQYDLPLATNGHMAIPGDDGTMRRIGIIRAHVEEDAGKNIHDTPGCTLVDLNRTGTPLLEIVTEPDLASGDEAYAFATRLQRLAVYLGASEGNMQQGQMRFEPNVNVEIQCEGQTFYTPISEVKNLNSFRHVRDAISYEAERQVQDWLENRDYVKGVAPNENRGWNPDKGVTEFQRGKEAAHDYRYFPDPDLMPLTTSADVVEAARDALPEMPETRTARFIEALKVSPQDAEVLVTCCADADLFDAAATGDPKLARRVVNLMMGAARRIAGERATGIAELLPDATKWRQLASMIEAGVINATAAASLLEEVLTAGSADVDFEQLAQERNLVQVQDEGQMQAWVDDAFAANEQAARDAVVNPKKAKAAAGFLTGQVMKLSGGKADPKVITALIQKKLQSMADQDS